MCKSVLINGIDLVLNRRIEDKLSNKQLLEKIFQPSELLDMDVKKLSGIFSVKEAVFKALNISASNWLEIEVKKSSKGKPEVILSDKIKPHNLVSAHCSISHDGEYTVGSVVMLLGEKNN